MRLAHPLCCAEVEIHQVAKRDRMDTVGGAVNPDVHKQSLLKDFNETLCSAGSCFPESRSRASSANSSLSGGEEGREGTSEVNYDDQAKSHFTLRTKRMKPRSKSKSKFYTPSPSSSIDGIDYISDIGLPESNLGSFGSPKNNLEGYFTTYEDHTTESNSNKDYTNIMSVSTNRKPSDKDVIACDFQENPSIQNTQLLDTQLSRDQLTDNHLPDGQSSDRQLSDENILSSPTNHSDTERVFRSPSTDRFSDLIAGSHVSSSQGDLTECGLGVDGDLVRPDTLTPNNSVTEIATRDGGGPVPLSRIKCLVSMTTPRDMHLFGTTSLPGFVEFNMSLDGFGCLFFPSIAPHVPPGERKKKLT